MKKIEYKQEKTNLIIYIVPAIFVLASILVVVVGYHENGMSLEFVVSSLLPGIALFVFVAVCFRILVKQEKRKVDDFHILQEQGQRFEGEILDILAHAYQVHTGDSWDTKYKFTFLVQYYDPFTGETVIRESIPTYVHYELQSRRCTLKVLDDEVLVETADVTYHKERWSLLDICLVFGFLAVVVFLLLKTILPILPTLK